MVVLYSNKKLLVTTLIFVCKLRQRMAKVMTEVNSRPLLGSYLNWPE